MSIREASPPGQYSTPPAGGDRRAPWAWRESGPPEPPKPRLLDRVRQALRARHLSRRTEEGYVAWIRRFIVFHDKRHPAEMGVPEVRIQITHRARVVELGKRHRMPVASEFGEFAQAGTLMSFGPSILDQFRYAASYVDRLSKGVKPEDLPVGRPRGSSSSSISRQRKHLG